jgi:hypothetical protein
MDHAQNLYARVRQFAALMARMFPEHYELGDVHEPR